MTDQELLRKIYADVAVVKSQNETIIDTQRGHTSAISEIKVDAIKMSNRLSKIEDKERTRTFWTRTTIGAAIGAAATAIWASLTGK